MEVQNKRKEKKKREERKRRERKEYTFIYQLVIVWFYIPILTVARM